MTELEHMVEHQRYLRLQHLLERSTIYSKFLLKQMDEQKDKEKKEREKTGRQKKVKKSNEEEKVIDTLRINLTGNYLLLSSWFIARHLNS